MKKILLVAALAALAGTACKKNYNCECTTTSQLGTISSTSAMGKMKKKDAENKCKQPAGTYSANGNNYTTTCALK